MFNVDAAFKGWGVLTTTSSKILWQSMHGLLLNLCLWILLLFLHLLTFFKFNFFFIQVSQGCTAAPCAFGCTSVGSAGYSCGCPQGYQRIGQGHCLSTITPASIGYEEDIGNVPTYPIGKSFRSNDKVITTEGCFSCKVFFSYHIRDYWWKHFVLL